MRHPATRSLVSLVLLLAVYYAIPEGVFPSAVTAGFSLLALVGGGGLLAWQITSQVRRHPDRRPLLHGQHARHRGLLGAPPVGGARETPRHLTSSPACRREQP